MKKLICLLCAGLLSLSCLFATSFKKGEKLYVSEKSTSLKSGTGVFSKKVGEVVYGDSVIVIESNSKKSKVQLSSNSKVAGWVSNSSLTSKKITKSGGGIIADELALAGKGNIIKTDGAKAELGEAISDISATIEENESEVKEKAENVVTEVKAEAIEVLDPK